MRVDIALHNICRISSQSCILEGLRNALGLTFCVICFGNHAPPCNPWVWNLMLRHSWHYLFDTWCSLMVVALHLSAHPGVLKFDASQQASLHPSWHATLFSIHLLWGPCSTQDQVYNMRNILRAFAWNSFCEPDLIMYSVVLELWAPASACKHIIT